MPIHTRAHTIDCDRYAVLMWGQSNSNTVGAISGLSGGNSAYKTPYPNVNMIQHQSDAFNDPPTWNGDAARQALGPVQFQATQGIGLEASLMRTLDARWPKKFVFAHMGLNGTSLVTHWAVNGTYPTGTNLFQQWLTYCKSAIQNNGVTNIVVVGNQGEGDALAQGSAQAWTTNYTGFVAAVRASIGNVPFVHVRVNTALDTGQYPFASDLYTAQTNAFTGGTAITNGTMVSTDSITLGSGKFLGVHYTADGYVDMGNLTATAVQAAFGL